MAASKSIITKAQSTFSSGSHHKASDQCYHKQIRKPSTSYFSFFLYTPNSMQCYLHAIECTSRTIKFKVNILYILVLNLKILHPISDRRRIRSLLTLHCYHHHENRIKFYQMVLTIDNKNRYYSG